MFDIDERIQLLNDASDPVRWNRGLESFGLSIVEILSFSDNANLQNEKNQEVECSTRDAEAYFVSTSGYNSPPLSDQPPKPSEGADNDASDMPEEYDCAALMFPETPPAPPPWLLSIGADFRKDIDTVDRKMQGRILRAVADLCVSEIAPHGDSLKPLKGNYDKFWRLRLGDFRLIFFPDRGRQCITLVGFGARGDVYDE